jgi:hypothetical protein
MKNGVRVCVLTLQLGVAAYWLCGWLIPVDGGDMHSATFVGTTSLKHTQGANGTSEMYSVMVSLEHESTRDREEETTVEFAEDSAGRMPGDVEVELLEMSL